MAGTTKLENCLALTPPAWPKPLRRGEGPALSPEERETDRFGGAAAKLRAKSGWQSAVLKTVPAPADCQSAIQQVANLRYERFVGRASVSSN
jgi:hypothetical protein